MGRLTLNVLLSFAQFEREVTSERIRDKIAASKKKGIWVGGVGRRLRAERSQARHRHGRSRDGATRVRAVPRPRNLVASATRPPRSEHCDARAPDGLGRDSRWRPARPMVRSTICSATGFISARSIIASRSYRVEHAPIIDRDIFEKVQTKLNENRTARGMRRTRSEALLLGRIDDDRDNRMSPSYAIKKGARYRYYISCVVQQGRKEDAGSVPRVAAHDVEGIVMNTLAALLPSEQDADQASDCERVERLVERVTVSRQAIEILLAKPNVRRRIRLSCHGHPKRSAASAM